MIICPNCAAENPKGANFCFNCGTKLSKDCPNCGTENPLQAKFCFNCGYNLSETRTAPIDQNHIESSGGAFTAVPQNLIPPQLADKFQAAQKNQPMEAERRIVTILFSDVVGSTRASGQLDPEDWTEIINKIFERMINPVYRYEGIVARLMGDAILAFFGAPIAHEDDPQRAVLAGLAIVEAIDSYRRQLKKEWGIEINVRVGINTGLVVVGAVGSDLRMEYTAMGDAINLAARMEQTAVPGTVQIAQDTFQKVHSFFDVRDLGGIEVKGKDEKIHAYTILGSKETPGRVRGIEGLDAPLIGRDRERALLRNAVNNLEQGLGGVICLIGEAGLGKSRLVSELSQVVAANNRANMDRPQPTTLVQWHETASLSYEINQPYGLFQRLIRHMIGVRPADSGEQFRQHLGFLIELFPENEQQDILPLFTALFGLLNNSGQPPLEGEAFKGRFFKVMSDLFQLEIGGGPVVLVFDDLHWSDPGSAALLINLLPLIKQGPLLIICALRPDPESQGWKVKETGKTNYGDRYTEIKLHALNPEESDLLMDNLLRISDLPQVLRARIQEKTEGNPFFLEEIVRTLIEQGVVTRDESGAHWLASGDGREITIPDNIRAVLVSRIDRLEESTRRVLQLASVIGRSFTYRVLGQLAVSMNDLTDKVLTLQSKRFIQETARIPELEYIFRHVLTQEAAYSTILLKQRRKYHRHIAEILESLFPDQVQELAGSLAHHFDQARDFDKALNYYTLAGDVAFRLFTQKEAIEHYTRAIDLAAVLPDVSSPTLIHLYSRRGQAFELDGQFDAALVNYQRMVELADERDDEALLLSSLIAQCIMRATLTPLNDMEEAIKLGGEALRLARETGDRVTEARALSAFVLIEVSGGGDHQKAITYGEQSLAIARELGLTEQIGYTQNALANIYMVLNDVQALRRANLEARTAFQKVGNLPMLADSYFASTYFFMTAGDYPEALAAAREALRIGRSIGNKWTSCVSLFYIGLVLTDLGDWGQALKVFHEGQELAEMAMLTPLKYVSFGHLILLHLAMGAADLADRWAEAIYRDRDQQDAYFRGYNLGRAAMIKVARGELSRAELFLNDEGRGAMIKDSLRGYEPRIFAELQLGLAQNEAERTLVRAQDFVDQARQSGIKNMLPELLLIQGRAAVMLDQLDRAHDLFREAVTTAGEIGLRRFLWRVLLAQADIEKALGNLDKASALRTHALEVVGELVASIDDPALKDTFLSMVKNERHHSYKRFTK